MAWLFVMYVDEFWVSRMKTGMRGRIMRWHVWSLCPVLVPRLMVYSPIFMAWVDMRVADWEVFVAVEELILNFSTASLIFFEVVFFFGLLLGITGRIS